MVMANKGYHQELYNKYRKNKKITEGLNEAWMPP
jgi:hypothetical protein